MDIFNLLKKYLITIYKKKIKHKFKNKRLGDVEEIFSNNNLQKKLFPHWKQKFNLKLPGNQDKSLNNRNIKKTRKGGKIITSQMQE